MKKNIFKLIACVMIIACITLSSTSCGVLLGGMLDLDAGNSIFEMIGEMIEDLSKSDKEDTEMNAGAVVKCELYYLDENGEWLSASSNDSLFENECWEPGYYKTHVFKLVNTSENSTACRIAIEGSVTELAEVVGVYYRDGEDYPQFSDMSDCKYFGTLNNCMDNGGLLSVTVAPNSETYFTISLKMEESAGNEYYGLQLGDIRVNANSLYFAFNSDVIVNFKEYEGEFETVPGSDKSDGEKYYFVIN